ncbi:hypothetical protein C0J52_16029 [Blattella germanica]|nr:hypothetical protein C0J52_16029 [Blattella germanica]
MVRILLAGQQFILGTKHFVRTGCSVSHSKRNDHSHMSEVVVEQVRDSFARKPRKSRLAFYNRPFGAYYGDVCT